MKNNGLYQEDIKSVLNLNCNFFELKKKTILITGATGLIGSVLVDMFVFLSKTYKLDLYLLLISRTAENFSEKFEDTFIQHIKCDVANENLTEKIPLDKKIDFIFHLASNTHPDDYSKYPIETLQKIFRAGLYLLPQLKFTEMIRKSFLVDLRNQILDIWTATQCVPATTNQREFLKLFVRRIRQRKTVMWLSPELPVRMARL